MKISICLLLMGSSAGAEVDRGCDSRTFQQAHEAAYEIRGWRGLYRAYQRYSHCDSGIVAEDYSDAVGHLLAHDWSHLEVLLHLTGSDANFRRFVVRHIDETMSGDEAALAVNNARRHCSLRAQWLCRSIAD